MNSPNEIALNYVQIGIKKANTPYINLFLSGILAGIFISLASVGANTAGGMIQDPGISKIVGALIFPVGLIMVIIAGSELFTGNCLMIISLLEKKISLKSMLTSWIIVYLGNLIGSIFIAYICTIRNPYNLFDNVLAVAAIKTAVYKISIPFKNAFVLGILCNFLVCIAVWMSLGGKTVYDKIIGIYFPVMLFVISGFEHSVANMYYISAGLFAKQNSIYSNIAYENGIDLSNLTWSNFFVKNLFSVTFGNIVGGVLIVGVVYWFLYLKKR